MAAKKNIEYIALPCIATRNIVVFPGEQMSFFIERNRSLDAVAEAFNRTRLPLSPDAQNDMQAASDPLQDGDSLADLNRLVFLVMQKDPEVEDPSEEDCFEIGTICRIIQKADIRKPSAVTKITVVGIARAKILLFAKDEHDAKTSINVMVDVCEDIDDKVAPSVISDIKAAFNDYCGLLSDKEIPRDMKNRISRESDPRRLFDELYLIMYPPDIKQELLALDRLSDKLKGINEFLHYEIVNLKTAQEVSFKTQEQLMQEQREYYLREEMKIIRQELGEEEYPADESYAYLERIAKLGLPTESVEKLVEEANRLGKMPYGSQEAAVIRSYLDTVLELPWNKKTVDKTDINKVAAQLDKDHYGMKKVKERILELIAVRNLIPDVKGQIICLVGPPGVGKTSIGKSIAKALGRKYARVSLGGIRDESDIRGHRKTYIGSMPGRIIAAVKQSGVKNPMILLDEIDKMANDFRGDPSSAMLEVLDSEQNKEFRDHYIEIPFDLSDVLFVTTANTLDTISPPLLDRMDVIELPSYTREEKYEIARRHLIPKQLKANGMNGNMLRFNDAGVYELIDFYTREAGVRTLERLIASICRKAAKDIVSKSASRITVTPETVEKYLGVRKFTDDLKSDKPQVGEVNGLAWTAVGGTLMPLEVLSVDGKGAIELTGSLGDVMKESAKIAVTYARSVAEKYGIERDFNQKKDIHIHAPEGAVPKDGPSAGVTMATAIISELSGMPVRSDVAMTGEITLRGKVLPIGGLREKTMAAYKAGIKTVVIPAANKPDLEEVDDKVKEALEFVFAETIEDVLQTALIKPEKEPDMLAKAPIKPASRIGARI